VAARRKLLSSGSKTLPGQTGTRFSRATIEGILMSTKELLESIWESDPSEMFDWGKASSKIRDAHEAATSTAERVLCLEMHKKINDFMESQLKDKEVLKKFQKHRGHDYHFLLLKEVMIGKTDGDVDPARMAEITKREIAAGRMLANNEIHILATAQSEEQREKALITEIWDRIYEREPDRFRRAYEKQPLSRQDQEILDRVTADEKEKAEKLFQALDLGFWPIRWPREYVPRTEAGRATYAKYVETAAQNKPLSSS
jgi:hypothetical protein